MRVRPWLDRKPRFGQRVFVAADAVVVGDVELGDDVGVWYGVVLRGDINSIRIGARTNVQDRVVVHVDEPDAPTVVEEDVTIGHAAVLHGCTVRRGALVGMHSTVLNGAVVGEEAMVAAGALVAPGTEIPARCLAAGVPAKVRRELSDDEVGRIRRGVRSYLELKGRAMAADDEVVVDGPAEWEKLS